MKMIQEKFYIKEFIQQLKIEKKELQELLIKAKRELNILQYMYETDVFFHHHGVKESLRPDILRRINIIKENKNETYTEYHPYWWNYNKERSSYMPLSMLGYIWKSEFQTIYEVPLDGTYRFYTYDSGIRGLGSMSYISVQKVEAKIKLPYINAVALYHL